MEEETDFCCEISLAGESAVGKTSFMMRLHKDTFGDQFIYTIQPDFIKKDLEIEGKHIKVRIWDMNGQEKHVYIKSQSYNDAKGVILLYDITRRTTFQAISYWLNLISKEAGNGVIIILIGSKCDLDDMREISIEEGIELSKSKNLIFYETSALKNININEVFATLVKKLLLKHKNEQRPEPNNNGRMCNIS